MQKEGCYESYAIIDNYSFGNLGQDEQDGRGKGCNGLIVRVAAAGPLALAQPCSCRVLTV